MKQKIAAHMSTLAPNLVGVDFLKLHELGFDNVSALAQYFNVISGFNNKGIDEEEMRIKAECEKLLSLVGDVMMAEEIASLLAYKRIQFGNRKMIRSYMQTLVGSLKSKKGVPEYPVLPPLREYSKQYFTGQDVMVYIGETGLEPVSDSLTKKHFPTSYSWVCGKVLLCIDRGDERQVHIILNNPTTRSRSLENRYWKAGQCMPTLFTRKEFFGIRKMIGEETHLDFIELFLKNCQKQYHGALWENPERIKQIIMDSNIEPTTDQELVEQKRSLIETAVELTNREGHFAVAAREMLRQISS